MLYDVVALHGFLGSPDDFDINPNLQVLCPQYDALFDEDLAAFGTSLPTTKILLGYSFGARIAAQLKILFPEKFKTLILLAGHLGLQTAAEKGARLNWEMELIQRMSHKESFLDYWNKLDLFKADEPLLEVENLEYFKKYIERFGLSKQDYLINDLLPYKDDIIYVVGERDNKYVSYVEQHIQGKFSVMKLKNAGHRIFRDQENINNLLMSCL